MNGPDNFIPRSLASNSPAPNPPPLTQLGTQPAAVEPAGVGQQQQGALEPAGPGTVAVPRTHLAAPGPGPLILSGGSGAGAQDIQYQTSRVVTSQQQQQQSQSQGQVSGGQQMVTFEHTPLPVL